MLIWALPKNQSAGDKAATRRLCWDVDGAVTHRGATHRTSSSLLGWEAAATHASLPLYPASIHTETYESVYIYTHTHIIHRHLNIIYCQSYDFLNIWRMWYLGNQLLRAAQINYRVNQHIASAWEKRAAGAAAGPVPGAAGLWQPLVPPFPWCCTQSTSHGGCRHGASSCSRFLGVVLGGFSSRKV